MNPREQNGSPSTADNGHDKKVDVLLVLAACSGDSHAFIELSKPHSKRILLTLYRITRNGQVQRMGSQGSTGQPGTVLPQTAAGGLDPIGYSATSPGLSQSR